MYVLEAKAYPRNYIFIMMVKKKNLIVQNPERTEHNGKYQNAIDIRHIWYMSITDRERLTGRKLLLHVC